MSSSQGRKSDASFGPSTSRSSGYVVPDASEVTKDLHCILCSIDVVSPRKCPWCRKLFCRDCYDDALKTKRRSCPHCHHRCSLNSFTYEPYAADFVRTVRSARAESLPTADECQDHTGKLLTVFCTDCCKSLCATCWEGVHQNHKIIPLEVASKRSRAILEKEVFPHLNSVADDFGRIKEQQVPALRRQYQQLKSDGDELIREMRTLAEGAWFEECRQQAKFIGILEGEEPLKWCQAEKEKLTELMNDSRLNRLADAVDATTLSNLKQKTAKLGLKPDQWPKLKDCFQVLTPYLPGWDVEARIDAMGIGEILRSKTRPFDVLRSFRVNDISWCVWAGSGRSIGLTASTEGSDYWRKDLAIYVTMKGRNKLQNYELCIERIPEVGGADKNSNKISNADNQPNNKREIDVDENATLCGTVGRSKIIYRTEFFAGQGLHFPRQDLVDWLPSGDNLSFVFKVRPLNYEQKLKDFMIFHNKCMADKSVFGVPPDPSEDVDGEPPVKEMRLP